MAGWQQDSSWQVGSSTSAEDGASEDLQAAEAETFGDIRSQFPRNLGCWNPTLNNNFSVLSLKLESSTIDTTSCCKQFFIHHLETIQIEITSLWPGRPLPTAVPSAAPPEQTGHWLCYSRACWACAWCAIKMSRKKLADLSVLASCIMFGFKFIWGTRLYVSTMFNIHWTHTVGHVRPLSRGLWPYISSRNSPRWPWFQMPGVG